MPKKYGASIRAYCLMTNHAHFVAVPKKAESLAKCFGNAHVCYTRNINKREDWKGHLWQARFGSSVLDVTSAPVIASHSCTREIYNHPRNLDDKMLRKLTENGGVIHIAMLYVTEDRFASTLSDFVDHIDHAVAVAGIDHVGIGSDFDGGGSLVGCYDVSEMKNITIELVKRGYNFEQIQKIWSGNFMRVFDQVLSTAERIRIIEKEKINEKMQHKDKQYY